MDDINTFAWIFLATAMASQMSAAKFDGISAVADYINHAVPTHKELQTSVTWLIGNNLIAKQGNKYSLTDSGKKLFGEASEKHKAIFKMRDYINNELRKL